MADRPRDDDWWLASDGRWYPPDIEPGLTPQDAHEPLTDAPHISRPFTLIVSIALSVASAVLLGAAFSGLRYASALQKYSGELSEGARQELGPTELTWASWAALALLALLISGILVIGWTYSASRSLERRGPTGRRWSGAWPIWSWIIPFANLVLPKFVFNEIEKIAQAPYANVPIGEEWRAFERSQLGDLWWLLWIGGVIPSQIVQLLIGDPAGDSGRLAMMVNVGAFSNVFFAGAGIALVVLVRRIEASSRASASADGPDIAG